MRPLYSAFTILVFSVLVIGCFPVKTPAADSHNGVPPGIAADVEEQNASEEATYPGTEDAHAGAEEESGEQPVLDAALDLVEASREYWVDGDVDKALEALDQAYALILQVGPGGDPKLIQQENPGNVRLAVYHRQREPQGHTAHHEQVC